MKRQISLASFARVAPRARKRRSRGRSSSVWKHFGIIDSTFAQCKLCLRTTTKLKYKKSTASLLSHLRKCHNIGAEDTRQSLVMGWVMKTTPKQQHMLFLRVLRCLVRDMRPLNFADTEAFRYLLEPLGVKIPKRAQLTKYILAGYEIGRKLLKDKLNEANGIAVTFDGWTSRATQSFVCLTAHFVDESFTLQRATLQIFQLKGSQTGVLQWI